MGRSRVPPFALGLQSAIVSTAQVAAGSPSVQTIQSFDGQPVQVGVHLRWSFAPELGFPPGCFWLSRRVATGDVAGKPIAPPAAVAGVMATQAANTSASPTALDALAYWNPSAGQPVRLMRADPRRGALLLERACPEPICRRSVTLLLWRLLFDVAGRLWRQAARPFRWIGDHVPR